MMSVGVFERVKTLIRADAHGVLESLEERSLLLKQYVREAELELGRKRARSEALSEESKRLRDELELCSDEIQKLDADVELALAGGEEELARFAIRRLLPRRAAARLLEAQIVQREEERNDLEQRLGVQEERLEALKTRARGELARRAAADESPPWLSEPTVADEEVELELMRRRAETEGGSS
jgi:phage shock protein A